MLEEALHYLREGLSIIPCSEKRPLVSWREFCYRLPTEEEVREWFSNPNHNIAFVSGSISGRTVIDIDAKNGGVKSWQEVKKQHPGLFPPTRYVITPSGGLHLHYQYAHVATTLGAWPGIDILSGQHLCMLPPSTINGKSYQWKDPQAPIASLSPQAWKVLQERYNMVKSREDKETINGTIFSGTTEGNRNITATKIAGILFRYNLSKEDVLRLLMAWNERNQPPLPPRELENIVLSIHQRAITQPPPQFQHTDMGNALLVHHLFGDKIIYDNGWWTWNGKYWQWGEEHVISFILQALSTITHERWRRISEQAGRIEAILKLLRPMQKTSIPYQPFFVNFQNGIVDLRTGSIMPHSPSFMMTHILPWDYEEAKEITLPKPFLKGIACLLQGGYPDFTPLSFQASLGNLIETFGLAPEGYLSLSPPPLHAKVALYPAPLAAQITLGADWPHEGLQWVQAPPKRILAEAILFSKENRP